MKRFRWNVTLRKSEPDRWGSLEQKRTKKTENPPLIFGCWVLVLQPNIEPTLPESEALSLYHWTTEMP